MAASAICHFVTPLTLLIIEHERSSTISKLGDNSAADASCEPQFPPGTHVFVVASHVSPAAQSSASTHVPSGMHVFAALQIEPAAHGGWQPATSPPPTPLVVEEAGFPLAVCPPPPVAPMHGGVAVSPPVSQATGRMSVEAAMRKQKPNGRIKTEHNAWARRSSPYEAPGHVRGHFEVKVIVVRTVVVRRQHGGEHAGAHGFAENGPQLTRVRRLRAR